MYLLFHTHANQIYNQGGVNDFVDSFRDEESAKYAAKQVKQKCDLEYFHIIDTDTGYCNFYSRGTDGFLVKKSSKCLYVPETTDIKTPY